MVIQHSWRTTLTTVAAALFAVGLAFLPSIALAQNDEQWVRNFVSSQDIQMTSMSLSAIGEVFIAGTFHGSVDFDPGPGQTLLTSGGNDTSFIAKYDPAGNMVWAYRLVGSGDVKINDIVVDSTAQIGVVGSFEGSADLDPGPGDTSKTSKGGHDIFVSRLLPDGSAQWVWTAGSNDDDMGFAIATDEHQGLYVTGKFEGTVDWKSLIPPVEQSNLDGTDVFVGRFNNAGTLFWINVFGGDEDDSGTDIALDVKDNVFVVGTFAGTADLDPKHTSTETQSNGHEDIFLSVMSLSGIPIDQTSMGGPGTESNAKVLVASDRSLYISGEFERTADFDTNADGGTVDSHGGTDIFVAHYGPLREMAFQWAYGIGGIANDTVAGIAQDGFKNLYVLGAFGGTVDFDPGPGTTELTSSGGKDIFIGKYSQNFQFSKAQAMLNPQDDRAGALAISTNNNVLFGGEYSGSIDLGNGLSVSTGQPDGVYSLFVAHNTRDTWTPLHQRAFLPGIISGVTGR